MEERKWDEVDLYILEVSKAIERASNKIKKEAINEKIKVSLRCHRSKNRY